MAKLVLIRGNGDEGCAFDLEKQTTTIGRAKRSDISIRLPTISRLHASIDNEKENGQVFLNTLSKKNYPFVNSKQVQGRVELADGDIIAFGPRKYLFRDPSKKTFGKENKNGKIKKKVSFNDTVEEIRPKIEISVPAPAEKVTEIEVPIPPATPANVLQHLTEASYTPANATRSIPSNLVETSENSQHVMMTPARKTEIEFTDVLLDDLCEAIRTPSVGNTPSIPTSLATRGDATSVMTPAKSFNAWEDRENVMDDILQATFTPISAAPSVVTSEIAVPMSQLKSKATTPAQARNITWEMIFERQMARSEEILRSANELGVSANELLDACANEIEGFQVEDQEEPCSPEKLLESEDYQVSQHTPALLAKPHVRAAFMPKEMSMEAAPQNTMPMTPGPSFHVVESDNAASPHQSETSFPSAIQIKRVLAEARFERASILSTAMSPKPTRFEATSAHSPHSLSHHMAAKPPTKALSAFHKFASPHVQTVRNPTRLMTPSFKFIEETASSPHQISTHCPALKSLKRLLAQREEVRSPSVRLLVHIHYIITTHAHTHTHTHRYARNL